MPLEQIEKFEAARAPRRADDGGWRRRCERGTRAPRPCSERRRPAARRETSPRRARPAAQSQIRAPCRNPADRLRDCVDVVVVEAVACRARHGRTLNPLCRGAPRRASCSSAACRSPRLAASGRPVNVARSALATVGEAMRTDVATASVRDGKQQRTLDQNLLSCRMRRDA